MSKWTARQIRAELKDLTESAYPREDIDIESAKEIFAEYAERLEQDALPEGFITIDELVTRWCNTPEKIAELEAARLRIRNHPNNQTAPAQASESAVRGDSGWLIENGKSQPDLRYRCIRQGLSEWTDDHNEALRFCRRIDAERFAEEDEDAWRIVEHAWHANPASPEAGEKVRQ